MLLNGVDMNIFLEDFRKCILSIIVKQDGKAALYETADIKRKADKYCTMMDGSLSWASFGNFNREVLEAAGLSHDLLNSAQSNKELIPYDFREICMNLQRRYIIDNYVEENNYYRMLHGEPDLEDEDLIYLGANIWGLTPDVPVHKLSDTELDYINNSEVIGILQKKYPTKKYLWHLGAKSISYFRARTALNYEILYLEKTRITEISNKFTRYYANSRNYVILGLYNKEDIEFYDDYDNFMGFSILTMAINRTFASIFTQGITREFYDDNLIRDLFENYNIPYEESIDVKYQREIAKKLNLLLQYKASNQVLFDITSLFSYRKVNIYKYYLMKDYKKDNDGNPIVVYKKVTNEDGEVVEVLDYENTYDIYFQKVDIKSRDPIVEISDPSNRIEYEALTGNDPYWIQDSDLITKLYQNKYNSIITKYMTIDVMFDLTKLIYETCHAFRLIFDRNEDTKEIKINLPYVDEPVSMYDVVTFLCAMVAKKFGLKGEIPLEPHNIATIYGFNFKTDIDYLRAEILDDIENNYGRYSKVDPDLISFIKTTKMNSVDDVRKMYEDIENLRIFIDTAMRYTKDIDAYYAYKKIYQSLLITTDVDEVYLKNDGTPAKTFYELLANRRPDLKMVIDETDAGHYSQSYDEDVEGGQEYDTHEINNKINLVLDKLGEISDRLSDMRFTNEKIEIVSNIEKIVNQMKSYTVDQTESGVIYMLNDPHMCMLKILDWLYFADIGMTREEHSLLVDDMISEIKLTNKFDEKLAIVSGSKAFVHVTKLYQTFIKFFHKIEHIFKEKCAESRLDILDVLDWIHKNLVFPYVYQKLRERYYVEKTDLVRDDIILFDAKELWRCFVELCLDSDDSIQLNDMISEHKITIAYLMSLALKEEIAYQITLRYKEEINFIHKICKDKNLSFRITTELIDVMLAYEDGMIKDRFKIRDFGDLIQIFHFNDLMKIVDEILSCEQTNLVKSTIDFLDTCVLTGYKLYREFNFLKENWHMDNIIHIDLGLKYRELLRMAKDGKFSMNFSLVDFLELEERFGLSQNLPIRDLYHLYSNISANDELYLKESYYYYLLKTYSSKLQTFDVINQLSLDKNFESAFDFKDRYYIDTFELVRDNVILKDYYNCFKWNYLNSIISFFDSLSLVCSYSANADIFKIYERQYYEYVIYPIEKILLRNGLLTHTEQDLSNALEISDALHLKSDTQINENFIPSDKYHAYFTSYSSDRLSVNDIYSYWLLKYLKAQLIISDSMSLGKDTFFSNVFKTHDSYEFQMGCLMKSFISLRDMLGINNIIEIGSEHLLYDSLMFSMFDYAKEKIFFDEKLRRDFLFQVDSNLPMTEKYKYTMFNYSNLDLSMSDSLYLDKYLNTVSENSSLYDFYSWEKLEKYSEPTFIDEKYKYIKTLMSKGMLPIDDSASYNFTSEKYDAYRTKDRLVSYWQTRYPKEYIYLKSNWIGFEKDRNFLESFIVEDGFDFRETSMLYEYNRFRYHLTSDVLWYGENRLDMSSDLESYYKTNVFDANIIFSDFFYETYKNKHIKDRIGEIRSRLVSYWQTRYPKEYIYLKSNWIGFEENKLLSGNLIVEDGFDFRETSLLYDHNRLKDYIGFNTLWYDENRFDLSPRLISYYKTNAFDDKVMLSKFLCNLQETSLLYDHNRLKDYIGFNTLWYENSLLNIFPDLNSYYKTNAFDDKVFSIDFLCRMRKDKRLDNDLVELGERLISYEQMGYPKEHIHLNSNLAGVEKGRDFSGKFIIEDGFAFKEIASINNYNQLKDCIRYNVLWYDENRFDLSPKLKSYYKTSSVRDEIFLNKSFYDLRETSLLYDYNRFKDSIRSDVLWYEENRLDLSSNLISYYKTNIYGDNILSTDFLYETYKDLSVEDHNRFKHYIASDVLCHMEDVLNLPSDLEVYYKTNISGDNILSTDFLYETYKNKQIEDRAGKFKERLVEYDQTRYPTEYIPLVLNWIGFEKDKNFSGNLIVEDGFDFRETSSIYTYNRFEHFVRSNIYWYENILLGLSPKLKSYHKTSSSRDKISLSKFLCDLRETSLLYDYNRFKDSIKSDILWYEENRFSLSPKLKSYYKTDVSKDNILSIDFLSETYKNKQIKDRVREFKDRLVTYDPTRYPIERISFASNLIKAEKDINFSGKFVIEDGFDFRETSSIDDYNRFEHFVESDIHWYDDISLELPIRLKSYYKTSSSRDKISLSKFLCEEQKTLSVNECRNFRHCISSDVLWNKEDVLSLSNDLISYYKTNTSRDNIFSTDFLSEIHKDLSINERNRFIHRIKFDVFWREESVLRLSNDLQSYYKTNTSRDNILSTDFLCEAQKDKQVKDHIGQFKDRVFEDSIMEEFSLITLTQRIVSRDIEILLSARNNSIELNENLQEKSSQKIDSSMYFKDQIWKMWYDEN